MHPGRGGDAFGKDSDRVHSRFCAFRERRAGNSRIISDKRGRSICGSFPSASFSAPVFCGDYIVNVCQFVLRYLWKRCLPLTAAERRSIYGRRQHHLYPDGAGGLSPFRGNRISGGDRVRRTGFCCLCLLCKKMQQLNRISEPYNGRLPLNRGDTST